MKTQRMQGDGKFLGSRGHVRSRAAALLLTGSVLIGAAADSLAQGINSQGAITDWLLLGPYQTGMGCGPALPDMRRDFLTDGTIAGDEWMPAAGDSIATDFTRGASKSWLCDLSAISDPSLDCAASPPPDPRVFAFHTQRADGLVDLNSLFGGGEGGDPPGDLTGLTNTVMAYAWAYVKNTTDKPIAALIGHNSDDSYRVLFNFVELEARIACRGSDSGVYDQDTLGPVILLPGVNVVLAETFEGGYGWAFRVRLTDPVTRQPLQPPDVIVQLDPPATIPEPPAVAVQRTLPASVSAGSTITITLSIEVNGPPPGGLEIRERIPYLWLASNPSLPEAGTADIETDANGRQTVVWTIDGTVNPQELTYDLDVPNPYGTVGFYSSFFELPDGTRLPITGSSTIASTTQPNLEEALVIVLKQGPGGGGAPGEESMRQDFLNDGDTTTEATVVPKEGESVAPDFNGASPSLGPIQPASLVAPYGLRWTRKSGPNNEKVGWIDLFPQTCDANGTNCTPPELNNILSYVAFYVVNPFDWTIRVRAGSSSDDGEQILVDGKEVWIHNIGRGAGSAGIQDHSPLFDLTPGKHLVLQKVFEGIWGYNCTFRLEDEDNNPVVCPYSLDPDAAPAYEAANAFVVRDIPESAATGRTATVSLKLRVRVAIEGGTIEENVPAGFAISEISGGGVQDGQKISWTLAGQLSSRDLTYRISIPEGSPDAEFAGTAELGGKISEILGDRMFLRGSFNKAGFIKEWLVLGPLETYGLWPGDPANPPMDPTAASGTPESGDIRLDYLTDGDVTEKTIRPFDGMRLAPAFGGDGVTGSKALGLKFIPRLDCPLEEPTWEKFVSTTGTFFHEQYFGGNVDAHATCAACSIGNPGPDPIRTNVAFDSDDACIAFLDGEEIGAYEPPPCSAIAPPGCGRGMGPEDSVVDVFPVTIPVGESFLLVRVHDGIGGSGFRLRFQDDGGNPLLPPRIAVRTLSAASPPPVHVRRIFDKPGYRGTDFISVALRIEAAGQHDVSVREKLPEGWTAAEIAGGGFLDPGNGRIDWDLAGVSGTQEVSYRLEPLGPCPGSGAFCGNGSEASQYTIDQVTTHALGGDSRFSRDSSGSDDLAPWDVRDIGTFGGGTQGAGPRGVYVTGKGGGVRLRKDEFRFVSIPASGDFEISAKVECFDDPGGAGQAGLMVRDTYDVYAANAFFGLTSVPPAAGGGIGTLNATFRSKTDKLSGTSVLKIADADKAVSSLPVWLQLKRATGKLLFLRSDDGSAYRQIASKDIGTTGTNINLKDATLIGLAVTGGGGGATRADLREVTGIPALPEFPAGAVPNPPRNLVAAAGDGKVSLSWDEPLPGPAFTGYAVARDGVKIADLPSSQRTYDDTGLSNGTEYCYVAVATNGASRSGDSNRACATPGIPEPRFKRADTNGDAKVDLTDAINVLGYLFQGEAAPACFDAADSDDSGVIDLTDGIYTLTWLFQGGPEPPAPGPGTCGLDTTPQKPGQKPFPACVYPERSCSE